MTWVQYLQDFGSVWYIAIMSLSWAGWFCTLFVYNKPSLPSSRDRTRYYRDAAPTETQTQTDVETQIDRQSPSEDSVLTLDEPDPIGVSILRPMSGLEPDLYDCLKSSFNQASTIPYEVILSAASSSDAAIEVAKRVISEYPEIDSTLIIGHVEVGVNPKINNLIKSFEASKYPILWILDSNTWISDATLSRSAPIFRDRKVNLVHHIPIAHAISGAKLGARLDDVYMATMHAKMYAIINFCSVAPCVMGKSNLIRKSALPEDGLRDFGKFIAEDHLIAVKVWKGRNTHVLASDCVRQPLLDVTWSAYVNRRIRWVRVRKYMTTVATLVEPFTECLLLGLVGATCLTSFLQVRWWRLWLIHVAIWILMDYRCWDALRNHPHDQVPSFSQTGSEITLFQWLTIWLLRETTALPIWCIAMSSDKIAWRGSQFVINSDMTARRVD